MKPKYYGNLKLMISRCKGCLLINNIFLVDETPFID